MFIKKKAYNKRLKPIYIKQQSKTLEVAIVKEQPKEVKAVEKRLLPKPMGEVAQVEEKKTEAPKKKKKNKKTNKKNDMADPKLKEVEELLDKAGVPERKVKIEKKDKGLFERTENSTILLTEDNKMVLND